MFKIITITFDSARETFNSDVLNEFIADKEVTYFQSEFFCCNNKYYWTILLEYDYLEGYTPIGNRHACSLPKKETLPQLTDEEFALFKTLKGWRREKAKEEGLPPYIIFNDSHLIEMIKNKPSSLEGLKNIHGIGEKKAEKYGKEVLNYFKSVNGEQ